MIELTVESVLDELTPIFKGETPSPEKPYSYFARAIRGGRENLENDRIIVSEMQKYSTVLSKHTVLDEVFRFEEEWKKRFPRINVSHRDKKLMKMSKYFVADFTEESCGTGFETCYMHYLRKPAVLFCHEEARYRTTMRRGEVGKGLVHYSTPTAEEVLRSLDNNTPIFFYNEQNIKEIAEREIRNLFKKLVYNQN